MNLYLSSIACKNPPPSTNNLEVKTIRPTNSASFQCLFRPKVLTYFGCLICSPPNTSLAKTFRREWARWNSTRVNCNSHRSRVKVWSRWANGAFVFGEKNHRTGYLGDRRLGDISRMLRDCHTLKRNADKFGSQRCASVFIESNGWTPFVEAIWNLASGIVVAKTRASITLYLAIEVHCPFPYVFL